MDTNRKTKLQILVTFLFLIIFNNVNLAVVANQGGYLNKISVYRGENLKFYISTSSAFYKIKIYKLGFDAGIVYTSPSIQGGLQFIPPSSYKNGCNWNESFQLTIPNNWEPGVYRAVFPVSGSHFENNGEIIFAVKTNNLGTYSNVGVILSVNTWQAYNNFGGKSLYEYNSSNSKRSYKVSLNRPFTTSAQYDFHSWAEKLVDWLKINKTVVEFITNVDLYENPNILSKYDVIIDVGHDEYVTREERNQMENFVNNGGRLMILSGNNYWWQVRFENNNRTMVCYKDVNKDPMLGVNNLIVTGNWFDYPLYDPENRLTGTSFREGGFVNNDTGYLPKAQGYGDYAAYNTQSWVFKNINLKEGDEFGYDASIVGYEVDGNEFTWDKGIPKVTGTDQTPVNFQILGLSPAHNMDGYPKGHSIMGIYYLPTGGAVFNTSTTNWTWGLPSDSTVQKITKNVLEQFLKNFFPPNIISWSPLKVVPANINNEDVFLNDRENILLSDSALTFHINAVDPIGEQINYYWEINGVKVNNSNSENFIFYNNLPSGVYSITAFAYNTSDTSQINWKLTTENNNVTYQVSGSVVYDNVTSLPFHNVTVKLTPANGGSFATTLTDVNGNYTFNNISPGTYILTATSSAQFPINYVNATDALLVVRYFVGLQTLEPLRLAAADVDNAGGANATDALVIIRRFADLISTFTKPDWIFETKQISVTNSDLTSQSLKGIATGDVDGSVVIN